MTSTRRVPDETGAAQVLVRAEDLHVAALKRVGDERAVRFESETRRSQNQRCLTVFDAFLTAVLQLPRPDRALWQKGRARVRREPGGPTRGGRHRRRRWLPTGGAPLPQT